MRLLSILARHGVEKYPRALDDLRAYQRSLRPSVRCELLVVDNAGLPPGPAGGDVIAGSGAHREFSAWDEGLDHVGAAAIGQYDLVHLVTSAFRTLHCRHVDRCDAAALKVAARRGLALGHIDYYDRPVELLGQVSQSWLRSSFVFLPPAALAELGSLVSIPDGGAYFSGDPSRPFRAQAPLSETYRQYLVAWLTGPGTGQGTLWHSRFDLSTETLALFEAKALAILNEHMLTIRLRGARRTLADATWLSSRARRLRWLGRAFRIPSWRDQLAARDVDAIRFAGAEPAV